MEKPRIESKPLYLRTKLNLSEDEEALSKIEQALRGELPSIFPKETLERTRRKLQRKIKRQAKSPTEDPIETLKHMDPEKYKKLTVEEIEQYRKEHATSYPHREAIKKSVDDEIVQNTRREQLKSQYEDLYAKEAEKFHNISEIPFNVNQSSGAKDHYKGINKQRVALETQRNEIQKLMDQEFPNEIPLIDQLHNPLFQERNALLKENAKLYEKQRNINSEEYFKIGKQIQENTNRINEIESNFWVDPSSKSATLFHKERGIRKDIDKAEGNLNALKVGDRDIQYPDSYLGPQTVQRTKNAEKLVTSKNLELENLTQQYSQLEPVVPLPNNAEKSIPKAIDRKKRHAEAHKNKREAIKKSVDDEILRGKPGTSAADVLTNEELSDVNKIEAEFATTPPKEDFIPPAAKNWIPPTKQPIQQEVPLATPVGDPYFKQPKIEPPGPTKLSPPVPGKNNVSSPIADSVKKAEEKLKNGARKVSAKETAKAAAKQGENLFLKASATMKKNYGAAIVTGALIGIAALSFMWDKLKERRAVENANIASDINNNNISNYQPEYTRQGIYDDLQSNSGPGNLALQMNKNAHRGKSYAR